MKSYQLQEVFLSQLLGNIEEDWKMILSSDSFKNIESFLTFLHLHPTKSQNSPEKLQFAQQQRFVSHFSQNNTFSF
jgi:flagellar biosynthesis chaperone FliJ